MAVLILLINAASSLVRLPAKGLTTFLDSFIVTAMCADETGPLVFPGRVLIPGDSFSRVCRALCSARQREPTYKLCTYEFSKFHKNQVYNVQKLTSTEETTSCALYRLSHDFLSIVTAKMLLNGLLKDTYYIHIIFLSECLIIFSVPQWDANFPF